MSLRILGNSKFDNIWLIDKGISLSPLRPVWLRQAQILNIQNYKGVLFIGTPPDNPDRTALTQFVNIVGYLNDYTVGKYPDWDPRKIPKDANFTYSLKRMKYGAEASLFEIRDEDSIFMSITFN